MVLTVKRNLLVILVKKPFSRISYSSSLLVFCCSTEKLFPLLFLPPNKTSFLLSLNIEKQYLFLRLQAMANLHLLELLKAQHPHPRGPNADGLQNVLPARRFRPQPLSSRPENHLQVPCSLCRRSHLRITISLKLSFVLREHFFVQEPKLISSYNEGLYTDNKTIVAWVKQGFEALIKAASTWPGKKKTHIYITLPLWLFFLCVCKGLKCTQKNWKL